MKRLIKSALLLLAMMVPATAVAYDFEVEGIFYNINGNEATVTFAYNEYDYPSLFYTGDVIIPDAVTFDGITYPVTAIGEDAFACCNGLASVDVPNSVTTIGEDAFRNCENLTSVTIGNAVTTIGEGAFIHCHSLTSVLLGNSVTTIGDVAFLGCHSMTNLFIPKSVTSIGGAAFDGCSGLTTIVVESGNTAYDSRDNCNALIETASNTLMQGCDNTVIPNSITAIGDDAFYGCQGLTNVTIPGCVTHIGHGAFMNCYALMDVYCYITDPSSLSVDAFTFHYDNGDYSGRTLHVPFGTANAYQDEWSWSHSFGQIVEELKLGDGRLEFIGVEEFPVIEMVPNAASGLNMIYVVYDTDGVGISYHSASGEQPVWYSFGAAGSDNAEEIPGISWNDSMSTLSQVIPNTGYKIVEGNDTYYCWVVNYADYYLLLNDMSINNDTPCDLLTFNIAGNGDAIPYYTVNGTRQVLDRDIRLAYNTIEWDYYYYWQEKEVVESFPALDQGVKIVPPLCITSFVLSGDRFLKYWGTSETIESEGFFPQAVDCRSIMDGVGLIYDLNTGEFGGKAPLRLFFSGYPTDAVAHRVWEMATDPDFENIIMQFNQDEVDYTFNDRGTYYVRYRVTNAAGTCEAYSDIYAFTVYGRLHGDVNNDDEVNIADVNAVTDIILVGNCDFHAADVNGDGEINIGDINAILDIIMGGSVTIPVEHE